MVIFYWVSKKKQIKFVKKVLNKGKTGDETKSEKWNPDLKKKVTWEKVYSQVYKTNPEPELTWLQLRIYRIYHYLKTSYLRVRLKIQHYVQTDQLKKMYDIYCSNVRYIRTFGRMCLSSLIYPLIVRVVGAPQLISQPVTSIFFSCCPLPSETWRIPSLSIP